MIESILYHIKMNKNVKRMNEKRGCRTSYRPSRIEQDCVRFDWL